MYGVNGMVSASGGSVVAAGVYYGAEVLTVIGIVLVAVATVLLVRPNKSARP